MPSGFGTTGQAQPPSLFTSDVMKAGVERVQTRSQELWILVQFLILIHSSIHPSVHPFTKYLLYARHSLSGRKSKAQPPPP